MNYKAPPVHDRITIHPGERWSGKDKAVVATLLGSCVSACLYDQAAGVAGMNHFLLANRRYARSMPMSITEAGRYGIHAMELLINDMIKLGASKSSLKAKVFGGGFVFDMQYEDSFNCVGEVNNRFIREFLAAEGIPMVSEDLGGNLGRYIFFHTDTYKVYRRFIEKREVVGIEREEHTFWSKSILEHETGKEGEVTLFT